MSILYSQQGATKGKNPVFFVIMTFTR